MCDMQCFKCKAIDCECDDIELTEDERKRQDELDTEIYLENTTSAERAQHRYNRTQKGKEKSKRYIQSDKGKATQRRYLKSDKGKATQQRYAQSEKGKAAAKRKREKKIASGKNAEYCRSYRARKKAEREANNEYL